MAHDPFGGLTGWDLEGFHNGGDTELWKRLGAFQCTVEDDERGPIEGVRFAVWAPNARAVQVIGDFNWWTGDPMQLIPGSGVWGTFIEGLKEETLYKFRIQGPDGVSPRLPRRRRPANGSLTGLAKRRTRAVSGKQRSDSWTNEVRDRSPRIRSPRARSPLGPRRTCTSRSGVGQFSRTQLFSDAFHRARCGAHLPVGVL